MDTDKKPKNYKQYVQKLFYVKDIILYSLKLKDVQHHIRKITEIFYGLCVAGDNISEEDRVVHLLANLPDSFGVLVIALESNAKVPAMEVVIKRLLHEEWKLKNQSLSNGCKHAFTTKDQMPHPSFEVIIVYSKSSKGIKKWLV